MEDDEQELDFGILVGKTIAYAFEYGAGGSGCWDLLTGKICKVQPTEYQVRLDTTDGDFYVMEPDDDDGGTYRFSIRNLAMDNVRSCYGKG